MFAKFTEDAENVMSLAREEAQRLKCDFIGTEHILVGIIEQGSGAAAKLLIDLNVNLNRTREEIARLVMPAQSPPQPLGEIPFSPRVKRTIELALEAAIRFGCEVIDTEHLLLALLKDNEGVAAKVLTNLGLTLQEVRDLVLEVLGAADTQANSLRVPPIYLEDRNLLEVSRRQEYRHIVDRPGLQQALHNCLQEGRSVALVGREHVGKTSLILALSRVTGGAFHFCSIDFRMFDEFSALTYLRYPRDRAIWVIPEAELITGSRKDYGEFLAGRRKSGEQLIFEFREGGLETFAIHYPNVAKDLVRIDVTAPDKAEAALLLESARFRMKDLTGYSVSDAILHEVNALSTERMSTLVPPFGAILALWTAVEIEKKCLGLEEVRQLGQDIADLDREKDKFITLQNFEEAAQRRDQRMELEHRLKRLIADTRSASGSTISMGSIRWSIDKLLVADRGAFGSF